MKINGNNHKIDTTVGELIATISEIAFENSDDAEEAYELTHLVLMEILKSSSFRRDLHGRHYSESKYLH